MGPLGIKMREWGVAILTAIVLFAAFAAPATVIADGQRRTAREIEILHEVLEDHDNALLEQQERTVRATVALTDGIACALRVQDQSFSVRKTNHCITDALRQQGFEVPR